VRFGQLLQPLGAIGPTAPLRPAACMQHHCCESIQGRGWLTLTLRGEIQACGHNLKQRHVLSWWTWTARLDSYCCCTAEAQGLTIDALT
jgi:hypothetical protein